MEDIAQASGYTKKTLYAYFKSKLEIVLWLLTDDLNKRWEFQKVKLGLGITGIEKFFIWGISLFDYCEMNPYSFQIQKYISYHTIDKNKVSETIFNRFLLINEELAEGMRIIFTQGIDDGSINKNLNVDMTISHFLYAYRGILDRAFSNSYTFADFDKTNYINSFLRNFSLIIKNNP